MKKLVIALLVSTFMFSASSFAAQKFSCDEPKTKCKEMHSCEEAEFYLNECGISCLDRDKDGVPCESICR